ncbi:MAG TPA: hypothetical protein VHG28_03810 [Longimicrobiaceae bacterium]|nr:hypothetical protein [Longimicrobiaceae bacterium]
MRETTRAVGRWAASAAMLAILGFGTTQAFASPVNPDRGAAACHPKECKDFCRSIGATGGNCFSDQCFCYWIIPVGS